MYALKELILPEGLQKIPSSFCMENEALESIDIPESVTEIGNYAFSGCKSLKRITGGEGVVSLPTTTSNNLHQFKNISEDVTIATGCNFSIVKSSNGGDVYIADQNGNFNKMNSDIITVINGDQRFKTSNGLYFENSSPYKTLNITYTGKLEDLSDRLKIQFRSLLITTNKSDAQFEVLYTDIDSGEETTKIVTGGDTHLIPAEPSTNLIVSPYTEYEGEIADAQSVSVSNTQINITINYRERADIYIQHKDGTLYTEEEWTAGGFSDDDANGTALISASHKFVARKKSATTSNTYNLGSYSYVQGVIDDPDGEVNTELLIAEVSSPAAQACKDYIFPCGKSGYMPSRSEGICYVENFANMGISKLSSGYNYILSYMRNNQYGYSIEADSPPYVNNRTPLSSYYRIFPFLPYGKLVIVSNKMDAQFEVTYVNIHGETTSQTLAVGKHRLDVKYNTEMTIAPITSYNGYECNTKTFTYGWDTEEHNMDFLRGNGVFIQHIDGNLYLEDEWIAGGFTNDQANGVAVVSDEVKFVIAKENRPDAAWGGSGKTVTDIVSASTIAIAILDYDGADNTSKIIEQLTGYTSDGITGAPAAESCAAYTFPNGKKGYLPAAGEWQLVYNNTDLIASAMTLIGGSVISSSIPYWSSTQCSANLAWGYSGSVDRTYFKYSVY